MIPTDGREKSSGRRAEVPRRRDGGWDVPDADGGFFFVSEAEMDKVDMWDGRYQRWRDIKPGEVVPPGWDVLPRRRDDGRWLLPTGAAGVFFLAPRGRADLRGR